MASYYPVVLKEEKLPSGAIGWFATHPDLPGCHAVADTQAEALARLGEAADLWLDWAAHKGVPIPPPREFHSTTITYAWLPDHTQSLETGVEKPVETVAETFQVAA